MSRYIDAERIRMMITITGILTLFMIALNMAMETIGGRAITCIVVCILSVTVTIMMAESDDLR